MKDCATDDNNFTYKPVNHEIYQKIKKDRRARYSKTYRENARKRKNGEYVVKQKGGAVPKLAALSIRTADSEPAMTAVKIFKLGTGWVEDTALRVHLRHFAKNFSALTKDALISRDMKVNV